MYWCDVVASVEGLKRAYSIVPCFTTPLLFHNIMNASLMSVVVCVGF